jgi:uncharacterized protein with PQ loop repeat
MPHIAHHKRITHQNFQALILKNRFLTRLTLALAVIGPLMTIPQIYEIWVCHRSDGVSVISWGFYVFSSSVWLLYGIKIKDRALWISSGLWVLMNFAVATGALIY